MRQFYFLCCILMWLPIGLGAQVLIADEQLEVNMAQQQLSLNWNSTPDLTGWNPEIGVDGTMEDFIPTAGATQTFTPAVGDRFYDTGGPGGGGLNPSGGNGTELPGNYKNCGCITTTTLDGVTELQFHAFDVFGDFDWLRIYDGTTTSGTLLYNSNTNSNTDTLAGMIAYHGSAVFTGTSGAITFEFNASTVVDHNGWDVEILATEGGGSGEECSQDFNGTPDTGVGFSNGYATANDFVVAGNSSFTLETITMELVALNGEPTTMSLEIFNDNGSGGVGTSTGETVSFDSSNMSFVPNGFLFGVYPQYTMTLTVPDIVLEATTDQDARFWLSLSAGLSTTGDFTYWVSYPYATNPDSYASWQNDGVSWFEYGAGVPKEGIMNVEGTCSTEGGGDPGEECSQDFNGTPDTGVGFSDGYATANDFVVAGNSSFTLETITMELVALNGEPTTMSLEIFNDNGSGGVGTSTGETVSFDSSNMSFVPNGFLFGVYPQYTMTLTVPDIVLEATTDQDARFWLSLSAGLSTTGDFTYWVSYPYATNPDSYASWQNDGVSWFEYGAGVPKEGIMNVEGTCSTGGDPGEGCEWTVSVFGNGLGDEVSWEFRDADGTVLLSGGPYSESPFMDVQTVTAADPVEFYIESMGSWNDNTPSFTIANENGIILNNSISGGSEATFSDLMCSDLPLPSPDNDNCEDVTPTTLTNGTPVTFTGTTEGATGSTEEINILGFPAVWEAVTLTGDCNNLTVDYCGTTPGVMDGQMFIVYTDSCPTTDFVIGNYDFTTCGDGNGTIRFYNLPAGTYYLPVIVDTTFNILGEYTMNVISEDCPPPPTNDDCEDAIPLSCGDSDSGSTLSANDSGGNPAGDVFYSFTGDGTEQLVTVSLCGSFYDTTLRIYSDCTLSNEIAFNDDSCGLQSEVSFLSDGTSTYIIMVEGYSSSTGEYVINLSCEEPPVYDPCAPVHTGEPNSGIGFSDGYMAANDFNVLANTQFVVEKVTLEVVTLAGDPTTFSLSFFEGETGVETPFGTPVDNLTPTSVTPSGYLFGIYPMFTVELTLPTTQIFPATTTADKKYWIAVASALDTTGGFTYWGSTEYIPSSTLPTWQNDGTNWFVYDDGAGGNGEGMMSIDGECETLGLSDISTIDFAYYPNPVTNILNIESQKAIEYVSAFNMVGQKVISELKVENGKIDLSSLAPGSYVFRVKLEGGQVETFKIIKK